MHYLAGAFVACTGARDVPARSACDRTRQRERACVVCSSWLLRAGTSRAPLLIGDENSLRRVSVHF
jgi:hypothetical protein